MHRHDVKVLLGVLQALVERGHTVVVIEHNLDVLKGGRLDPGGRARSRSRRGPIVAEGPPEEIAAAGTATSPFLRDALGFGAKRAAGDRWPGSDWDPPEPAPGGSEIVGARENNLKNISADDSPPRAECRHRHLGIREIDPGLRHHFCRGPAPVHGIDVPLRPAIRRAASPPRSRPRFRDPPDGRDRAAGHPRFAQVDGRDHHGGRPIPSASLRAESASSIIPIPGAPSRPCRRPP